MMLAPDLAAWFMDLRPAGVTQPAGAKLPLLDQVRVLRLRDRCRPLTRWAWHLATEGVVVLHGERVVDMAPDHGCRVREAVPAERGPGLDVEQILILRKVGRCPQASVPGLLQGSGSQAGQAPEWCL